MLIILLETLRCGLASDSWQQLKVASELEASLQYIMEVRKRVILFHNTQSNNAQLKLKLYLSVCCMGSNLISLI